MQLKRKAIHWNLLGKFGLTLANLSPAHYSCLLQQYKLTTPSQSGGRAKLLTSDFAEIPADPWFQYGSPTLNP